MMIVVIACRSMYVCIYVCMYLGMHVCICVYLYVCTYTHIHVHCRSLWLMPNKHIAAEAMCMGSRRAMEQAGREVVSG